MNSIRERGPSPVVKENSTLMGEKKKSGTEKGGHSPKGL